MIEGKNYCISRQNLACHEWIGLEARVAESSDLGRVGLKGRIVDETKNLVVIETGNGEKKMPKKEVKLVVSLGNEEVLLDCSGFEQRPEDRIKYFGGRMNG